MQSDVEEVLIPLVQSSEFELARVAIEGFEPWASYTEYLHEREARIVGLAWAGRAARLAPVSVRAFLDWSAMADAAPTLALLDCFAAMTKGDVLSREVAQSPAWTTGAPTDSLAVHGPNGMEVTVDLTSYREWLACLGEQPSDALLDAYVGLIVECWSDGSPQSPADAGRDG